MSNRNGRDAHHFPRVLFVYAALALLLTVSQPAHAIPLVVKANLGSIGGSAGPDLWGHDELRSSLHVRVVELGVGTRLAPRLGVCVGGCLIDSYGGYYTYAQGSYGTGFVVTAGGFWANSLREAPRSMVVYTRADCGPAGSILSGSPEFVKVSAGANWTFWFANPELELYWLREYRPENGSWGPGNPPSLDHYALAFRVGLGGWYEF